MIQLLSSNAIHLAVWSEGKDLNPNAEHNQSGGLTAQRTSITHHS